MRRSLALLPAVLSAVMTLPAFAQPFSVATDMHTRNLVRFTSEGTLVSFSGETPDVLGKADVDLRNLAHTSGMIKINLATLQTGIGKRDEHMRNVLEVSKFPFASFQAERIHTQAKSPTPGRAAKVEVEGSFSLHGVTRRIRVPALVVYLPETDRQFRSGDWIKLETSFPVRLADYGITPPGLVPAKVADTVQIQLTAMARAGSHSNANPCNAPKPPAKGNPCNGNPCAM